MSGKPKTIPFFENSSDNFHCLQSCVKSLLLFYFPDKVFTDEEIDAKTIQTGGWTWLPPTTVWLYELGLDVKLYSQFDYEKFSDEGELFMKAYRSEEEYAHEKRNGGYDNLSDIQKSSKVMINHKLWEQVLLTKDEIEFELENENTFVIGKTVYEWLEGREGNSSHYVLVIKKYAPNVWRVHDPGLPGKENRKILQDFGNHNIFGDILVIRGLR